MEKKEKLIDLSDIKDNELDKTASFTDLMSRSERRKREKEKNDNNKNENIINDNVAEIPELNIQKSIENNENLNTNEIENILNETNNYNDNSDTIDDEIETKQDNELDFTNKKYGSGIIITMALFLIISISIFLYYILFTHYLDKNKYLYIDCLSLLSMFFLFGLSIIVSRKFSKFISILNYIIFIAYIGFNSLLFIQYIK